jgi:hypothetical protein
VDPFPIDTVKIKKLVCQTNDDSLVTLAQTFEMLRQSAYLIKNCEQKAALVDKIESICIIIQAKQLEIINKHRSWRNNG